MTLPEAIEAVRLAGAHLALDAAGPFLRGHVPAEVVSVLREHRDRVEAVLRLRQVHQAMGFAAEDISFIEEALLSERITEVRIVARPPVAVVA